MAMISFRIGLTLSALLSCCGYTSTFVLMDTGTEGENQYSKDVENRVLFLTKFLHQINTVRDTVQSLRDVTLLTDTTGLSKGAADETNNVEPPIGEANTNKDAGESPTAVATKTNRDKIVYTEKGFKDIEDLIEILRTEDTSNTSVKIEKKDYAILPPASEWCRLMGFRRCRGSHS